MSSEHKHHGLFHHHDKNAQTQGTVPVQVGEAEVCQKVPVVANVPVNQTSASSGAQVFNEPAVVTRHENAAAVAEERVLRKEEQHLQPVITRDIEKTEIHQIQQPVHETAVLPTHQNQKVLAEQNIEKNYSKPVAPMAVPQTARVEGQRVVTQVEHAPVIQERVHTKVVEDVQPMIYREVIAPEVTTITKPIHEHIVEAPVVVQSTAPLIDRGTATGTTGMATTTTQEKHGLGEKLGLGHKDHDHAHKDHSHTNKNANKGPYISGDYINGEMPTSGTQIRAGDSSAPTPASGVHQTYKGEYLGQGKLVDQSTTTGQNFTTGQAK